MVDPRAPACDICRMATPRDSPGIYGFYEAVDYTASRLCRPGSSARSPMLLVHGAHHEGMSFLSLDYALRDRPMQRRFATYPPFQAAEMLLHERISEAAPHPAQSAQSTENKATTAFNGWPRSSGSAFLIRPTRLYLKCNCSPTAGIMS